MGNADHRHPADLVNARRRRVLQRREIRTPGFPRLTIGRQQGIEGLASQADNDFRTNDIDHRNGELPSRSDHVAKRDRFRCRPDLYVDEQIRRIHIAKAETQLALEEILKIRIRRELRIESTLGNDPIERSTQDIRRRPILADDHHIGIEIVRRLRPRRNKWSVVSRIEIRNILVPTSIVGIRPHLSKGDEFVHSEEFAGHERDLEPEPGQAPTSTMTRNSPPRYSRRRRRRSPPRPSASPGGVPRSKTRPSSASRFG